MYGSYGSYSSLPSSPITSPTSSPLDISPSPMRSDTCAFPSWPRRSALSEPSCTDRRASSYLSDDDLCPQDLLLEEDDDRSVSSAGSGSSFASPVGGAGRIASGSSLVAEMERQKREMAKEYVKMLVSEKEKRRASKKGRRGSGGSRKGRKGMTPIVEGGE